jgi:hypothetical protein
MVEAMKGNGTLSIGVDHDNYRYSRSPLPAAVRDSLCRDLA